VRPLTDLAFKLAKAASYAPRGGRFFARLVATLVPGLRCYPVETRYGRIYCDLRETPCFPLLRHGEYPHWREDETGIARIPLNSASIVLDVGANIGVTARMFAARAGHVHAFEPSPRALAMLRANTADLENVTIHPFAVSNVNGTVYFEEKFLLDTSSLSDRGLEVQAKAIDSLGLVPDFIKMDVEGFEHLVLEGASETLKYHAPVIMFEALSQSARDRCEKLILGANPQYRFEALGNNMNHIAWPADGIARS
jgi:FkbM family methyltransferase